MCFHNALSKKIAEIAKRYRRRADILDIAEEIVSDQYHVNAFLYPAYPVITYDEEIQPFFWGLIPFWTRTEEDAREIRSKTLNARAESLFTKPSFREPIRKSRCLIPATGFFEWRHEDGKKIPYFIRLKEEEIFSMAGVYDFWRNPETNSAIGTFTQITTDANPLLAYIHNSKKRMPAIIAKADEEKWVDPELSKEDIELLLKPFDEEKMEAYRVSPDFLKKNPHDASILEKVN